MSGGLGSRTGLRFRVWLARKLLPKDWWLMRPFTEQERIDLDVAPRGKDAIGG